MSESEQVRDAGTDAPETAVAVSSLSAAMQSLFRAYQKTSIYPADHPAIPAALNEALSGLGSALSVFDCLTVRVAKGKLLVNDEPLPESRETIGALSQLLHELDLIALEFHRGLTLGELDSFIQELGRAKRDDLRGPAFVEALAVADVVKVRPRAVDYGALRFSQGAREPLDGQTRQEVWDNLTEILADPDAAPVELSPAQLATEIAQEITNREGSGVGLLKRRVELLNSEVKGMSPAKREAVRKRIADFVTALSPKLRSDLLRIDPKAPEASLELMTELADRLSESDLLQTLRLLDSKGARVPESLLTLLNKLIRISHEQPSLAEGLRRKLKSWGVKTDTPGEESNGLRQALQEIFQRRERGDYLPEPHNVLLNDLSHHTVGPRTFNVDGRYRDPRDMYDVRLQAAQVAVRLVGGKGGERQRAGIFAFLAAAADSLIERGHFEVLYDAAVAARTYSLLKTEPEGTRRSARGYLAEFTVPRQIQRILEHGCGAGFSQDALNLLSLGGAAALDRILDFLDLAPPATIAGVLEEFAAGREPRVVAEVAERRMRGGWAAVRPLLRVLKALPSQDAVPLLDRLAAHEEPRVRRRTLGLLCDLDDRPGSVERNLRVAFADSSPRVVALALRRSLDWSDDASLGVLADYVEGATGNRAPGPGFARRAAMGLRERGARGVARLCACLDRTRASGSPSRARASRAVAETLADLRGDPSVRRCLRRWTWSINGALARVLPREAPRRRTTT